MERKKKSRLNKDEIAQVKKRNKQLAFIMASGESKQICLDHTFVSGKVNHVFVLFNKKVKEKSELLFQIEELTNLKNELTSQVSEKINSK